jgi:hypothetical protein
VASQSFPCSFGCLDPQWCLPGRWKMTKGSVKKPLLWISMVYTVYRTYRHIMNRSRWHIYIVYIYLSSCLSVCLLVCLSVCLSMYSNLI